MREIFNFLSLVLGKQIKSNYFIQFFKMIKVKDLTERMGERYRGKTKKELLKIAKQNGVIHRKRMDKEELIRNIIDYKKRIERGDISFYMIAVQEGFFSYAGSRKGDHFRKHGLDGIRLTFAGSKAMIEVREKYFGKMEWLGKKSYFDFDDEKAVEYYLGMEEMTMEEMKKMFGTKKDFRKELKYIKKNKKIS